MALISRLMACLMSGAFLLMCITAAHGVEILKEDNTNALSLASSWVGGVAPGTGDVAVWDNTVTGTNSVDLGALLDWQGLRLVDPGGPVTIGPSFGLTLGGTGVDMAGASQDLRVDSGVVLATNQAWGVGAGRMLTVGAAVSGGFTLTKAGAGSLTLSAGNNPVDFTVNAGTLLARGGGWTTSFAANRTITVNSNGTLDTVVHSLGGLGGATRPNSIVLNGGTWLLNNEQQLPNNALTLVGGVTAGAGEVRGGGTINVDASATTATLGAGMGTGNGGITINVADGVAATDLQVNGYGAGGNGITFNSTGETRVSGNIGIGGALTKNGAGTLTFVGLNNLSGNVNINAGVLSVVNGGKLYNGTHNNTGVVQVNTGATLRVNTFNYDGSLGQLSDFRQRRVLDGGTVEVTGNSQNSGNAFTVNTGGGTFRYTPAGQTLTLRGNANSATQLDGSLTFEGDGNIVFSGGIDGPGGITKASVGTLSLAGPNTYAGGTIISAGTLSVGNGGADGTLGSGFVVNDGTLVLNRTNDFTLGNQITGSGAVRQVGSGMAELTQINTYTGGTTVDAGILRISSGGVNGGIRGTLTINSNATVELSVGDALGYGTGAAQVHVVNINNATLRRTGGGNETLSNVAITMEGGEMAINGGVAGQYDLFNGGTTFTVNNPAAVGGLESVISGAVRLRQDNSVFTVNSNAVLRMSGTVAAHALGDTLTKNGAGLIILAANNSYDETTVIDAGTLQVGDGGAAGSLGSGAVQNNASLVFERSDVFSFANGLSGNGTVAQTGSGTVLFTSAQSYPGTTTVSAGNLWGTGSISSSVVSVVAGGTLGPADTSTPGTFTVENLSLQDQGHVSCLLNGTTATTRVTGTLTTSGTNWIDLVFDGDLALGSHTLLDYTGAISGDGAGALQLTRPFARSSVFLSNNVADTTIDLHITSLPVPTNLVWRGQVDGQWDDQVTANWVTDPGGLDLTFTEGDSVRFDDTALVSNVVVAEVAMPVSMTVSNAAVDFLVSGETIAGAGGLSKVGDGMLTLANDNTFTGATTINGGALQLGNGGASGSLSADSTVTVAVASELIFNRSDNAVAIDNDISGAGDLVFNGTTASGESGYTLDGDNSGLSGDVRIDDSRVTVDSMNDIGAASVTVEDGGQLWVRGGVNVSRPVSLTGNGWLEGAGLLGALRFGGGETLSGPVTLTGDTRISPHAGANGNIIGEIGESGGSRHLTFFNGAGGTPTVVMTASNTYSGGTRIDGSQILRIEDDAALGAVPASFETNHLSLGWGGRLQGGNTAAGQDVTVHANRGVDLVGGTGYLHPWTGFTLTIDGPVTGVGSLRKSDGGTAVINGNCDYTGTTYVEAGRLEFAGTSNGIPGAVTINGNGRTLTVAAGSDVACGAVSLGGGAGNRTLSVEGSLSAPSMSVPWPSTVTVPGSGVVSIAGEARFTPGAACTISGPGTFNANGFDVANFGTLNVGSGGTTLNVSGSFMLGDAFGQSGNFNQQGGTVNLTMGGNLIRIAHWGGESSAYTLSAGTLNVPNTAMYLGWDGSGTLRLSGTSAVANVRGLALGRNNGTLDLQAGRLNIGQGGIWSSGGFSKTISLADGTLGTLTNWSSALDMILTNAASVTTINALGGDITLSGALMGHGALTKTGPGELRLDGTCSYTGATLVAEGALGGSGRIVSPLSVAPSAALAPGGLAATGIFAVSNSVTFADNGELQIGIAGASPGGEHDQLVVSGALDLSSGAVLRVDVAAGYEADLGQQFTIVEGFNALSGTFKGLPGGAAVAQAGQSELTIRYDTAGQRILLTASVRGMLMLVR